MALSSLHADRASRVSYVFDGDPAADQDRRGGRPAEEWAVGTALPCDRSLGWLGAGSVIGGG